MTRLDTKTNDPVRHRAHDPPLRRTRAGGTQNGRQATSQRCSLDRGGQTARFEPADEARRVSGSGATGFGHGCQGALVTIDRLGIRRHSNELHDPMRPRLPLRKQQERRTAEIVRLATDEKPVD